MAIIKCKMCGGDMEISANKTFGVCEYCGSTMTLPKVDSEQRAAIFNRGNHFRRICEFDKALAVYERIVAEDDTDAEAHWCCVLCRFGIEYVEDPATMEYIPTCHRASFDSFLEDVDYLAAVEHSDGLTRRQYQKDAAKIAEVQRGILATSQTADPFDVFICYKETDEQGQRTRDSMLAQDIYYQLTEEGYRVFFSRITLEDVAGTQYEPYIFAALNSAKVMVAVGTKAEHLNAVWVKNEWSRFLALMKKDRSKLLLPCYRDMDPYDLPEQLGVLQSYDMSKIGFIQDLIRGVSKVLDASKKEPEPVRTETVVVQQPTNSSADALVDRGFMSLEDGEWEKADHFFEESLNQNAKNSRAYLGKYLASRRQPTLERVIEATRKRVEQDCAKKKNTLSVDCIDSVREVELVQRYIYPPWLQEYDPRIKSLWQFDNTFQSSVATAQEYVEDTERWLAEERNLNRALQYGDPKQKQELEAFKQRILQDVLQLYEKAKQEDDAAPEKIRQAYEEHLKQAEDRLCELREKKEVQLETDYQAAVKALEQADTIKKSTSALQLLQLLLGYKDSGNLVQVCNARITELRKAEEKRQAEVAAAKAAQEAQRLKEQKKRAIRNTYWVSGVVAAAVAIALLVTQVILPFIYYQKAEKLLAAGKAVQAAVAFGKVGEWKDSSRRSREIWSDIVVRHTVDAEEHIVSLKTDGTAMAEGVNLRGRCDVSEWADIAAVTTGHCHTVGLKSDGSVVAVGDYKNGQCDVSEWADIVDISAGAYHTVGLKSDGTVIAAGNNEKKQCEVSNWADIVTLTAGLRHTVGLKSNGTVVAVGENRSKQCEVSGWTDIVSVFAGSSHTVGLKLNGTVVAVGYNAYGQCDVSEWSDIVAVSAGGYHTVGLKSDGTVLAVGDNKNGQCDVSEWKDVVAVAAGSNYTVGVKSDGTAIFVGSNKPGQYDLSGWVDIKLPNR
ncbi:MAG: TIR domain-containing protein [Oscillospiraceae bacterium]|nr:TIR domain-containing protein [Oscillospiraceae bacterium]